MRWIDPRINNRYRSCTAHAESGLRVWQPDDAGRGLADIAVNDCHSEVIHGRVIPQPAWRRRTSGLRDFQQDVKLSMLDPRLALQDLQKCVGTDEGRRSNQEDPTKRPSTPPATLQPNHKQTAAGSDAGWGTDNKSALNGGRRAPQSKESQKDQQHPSFQCFLSFLPPPRGWS